MDYIAASDFLLFVHNVGVALDERYVEPRTLVYMHGLDLDRFWAVPRNPQRQVGLIASVLDGFDPWSACFLWPRDGWDHASGGGRADEAVYGLMLRSAGARADFDGAIRYAATERAELATALFAAMSFGWSVADDLFVLPDHGQQLMGIDHHDAVHVSFAGSAGIDPFVAHMAANRFPLPRDVPDATFERPEWMPR